MDQHTPAKPASAGHPAGGRLWIAVAVSLVVHAMGGLVIRSTTATEEEAPPPPMTVDIEVAPVAPEAELLPVEVATLPAPIESDLVTMPPAPDPAPPEIPPTPAEPEVREQPAPLDQEPQPGPDAGVDAAVPEPADAGPAIATRELTDAGVPPADALEVAESEVEVPLIGGGLDGGVEPPLMTATATVPLDGGTSVPSDKFEETGTGAGSGDQTPASAGTAANLLAYFPKNHMVTVLLRFDRLRGTEWAKVAQNVLKVMPDYEALVASPRTKVADVFDLVAMSSARPKHASATLLAVKSALPRAKLRDFLDEPGAPVEWSRVTGGVLGTRTSGDRTIPGDKRVFLGPYDDWMVLANPSNLKKLLDPVEGDVAEAVADPMLMPEWLKRLPELEAESGLTDGPALMMSLAPKARSWKIPDVGLGVDKIPAPERMTLSLEIDPSGFIVKGNLVFRSDAEAAEFVTSAETARTTALDTAMLEMVLRQAKAFNAIKGLTFKQSGKRVSYATSLSIKDARVLMAAGTELVAEMFTPGDDDDEPAKPEPAKPEPAKPEPAKPKPEPADKAQAPADNKAGGQTP